MSEATRSRRRARALYQYTSRRQRRRGPKPLTDTPRTEIRAQWGGLMGWAEEGGLHGQVRRSVNETKINHFSDRVLYPEFISTLLYTTL